MVTLKHLQYHSNISRLLQCFPSRVGTGIRVDRFVRTRTIIHLFKGEEEDFVYVLLGACGNIYINGVGGYKMIDDAIST